MRSRAVKTCVFLAALCLLFSILAFAACTVAFTPILYRAEGARLQTANRLGITEEEYALLWGSLVNQMQTGEDAFLQVSITAQNGTTLTFSPIEQSHMRDVSAIMQALRVLGPVLLILALIMGAVTCLLEKQRALGLYLRICKAYFRALGLLLLAVAVCLAFFDQAFTLFHHLFFSNSDWLLPMDSLLIRLFPDSFFMAGAAAILAVILVFSFVLWLLGHVLKKPLKRPTYIGANENGASKS